MHIKTEDKNGIIICYLEGELNLNTAPQLKKAFEKLISEKQKKIVINFTDLSYIDSSGLATLVEIFKKLRAYGGVMKLVNLSTKIKSLFEITKLEKLFEIIDNEEKAIASFA
ncbi:MAG: anti-sigma factor antagonist [Candidatus Omnitrophica bacterium CG07_land_8_20_14_0_80_42_15]|uniref:Anti-sigma factor antagonist n=1 Tax=Candidatus Aquitaenariimonas noxiae TaxID=1974741 RepID=A0A2J0KX53_9BACT|nr:MAG: anti-sigma factor antagonist [Candidatus Omnitrophica bacterium CG07_land_8_20_14_0_80_42_15]